VTRDARVPAAPGDSLAGSGGPTGAGPVVVFRVAGDRYALPLHVVAQVLPAGADGRERGVARLSARACLGYGDAEGAVDAETRGILLRLDGDEVVLSVDEVDGVAEVDAANMMPPPEVFAGRTAELLRGVARAPGGGLILLLIPEALRLEGRGSGAGPSDADVEEGA